MFIDFGVFLTNVQPSFPLGHVQTLCYEQQAHPEEHEGETGPEDWRTLNVEAQLIESAPGL